MGATCLSKGADPALQKASVVGTAASTGFCRFLPLCQTVWLSHRQWIQILCVWRRGNITGYASIRRGEGLLRLLYLLLLTSFCRMFQISVPNGITLPLEDAIRAL